MKPRISLITLGVTDLKRATAFYRDGLGLPTRGDFDDVVFFVLEGVQLSLFPRDALAADAGVPANGSGFAGITLAHNVESEAKVRDVMGQAERAGAKIVLQPQNAEWGGYHGYFTDPDGHFWEVAYPMLAAS